MNYDEQKWNEWKRRQDRNGYNHNRPLADFQNELDIILGEGFFPIAVSQMYLEDAFVFDTQSEAWAAYEKIELKGKGVVGWWYGKDYFLQTLKEYEEQYPDTKVLVYWLNKNNNESI